MSEIDLEHLKKLCEAAKPRSWMEREDLGNDYADVDKQFISAARSSMPRLIEEVERLQKENSEIYGTPPSLARILQENQSLRELLREAQKDFVNPNSKLAERIDKALGEK